MNVRQRFGFGCGGEGPWKYPFWIVERSPSGSRPSSGIPSGFEPGDRRLVSPRPPWMIGSSEKKAVGSWPPISGEVQRGGKIRGGGFGCGAQAARFATPNSVFTLNPATPVEALLPGTNVPDPLPASVTTLSPVWAQMLPPPAWHPNGWALLKLLSRGCPSAMSPTDSISGNVATMSLSELSRASVKTPADPPLTVQDPGVRGGTRAVPCRATLGLFGKLEFPSTIGFCGSWVGLPGPCPKPFRSSTEMPGRLPPRPM